MTEPFEVPRIKPHIQMKPVEGCLPEPPEGFQPFEPDCPTVPKFRVEKLVAGGRSVVVVPYDKDVCSGGRGTFQIISGMGGQICDAIYLGNTVGRRATTPGLPAHGVGLQADGDTPYEPDVIHRDPDVPGGPLGEKGVAVRDRGQWYVVKMGEGGGPPPAPSSAYHPATVQTDLVGQESHWETPNGPSDWGDFDLPIDYEHGDDFPNADGLPPLVGWARLRKPSMVLEGRSGDAGNPNLVYGGQTNVLEGEAASLVQAAITASSSTVRLWFSHNVQRAFTNPSPDSWGDYITVTIRNTLTDLPVSGSALVVGQPNAVDVTIAPQPVSTWNEAFGNGVVISLLVHSLGEKAYESFIETAGAFTYTVGAVGFLGFFNDDRGAYVLVMNRVSDFDISKYSSISVSNVRFLDIPDEQVPPNVRRVYDFTLGNEKTAFELLRITGGNSLTAGATTFSGLAMGAEKPIPLAEYSPTATVNNWPLGIGRANRMNPDGSTTPVLVTNWYNAPSMITGFLITGTPVTAGQLVTLRNDDLDIEVQAYLVRNV